MKTLLDLLPVRNKTDDTPVSYGGGSGGGLFASSSAGGTAGMTDALGSTASVGTLFAIVNRTSNATSQAQWKLWRKPAGWSGDDADRVEVTRHLALDVWRKPNPFMTQQEFVEVVQQHIDLTGEGWPLFGKNAVGWPETIWPVRPDKMTVVPSPTKYISGYVYTGPDGEKVPLGVTDIAQIRMPNPLDPFRGLGPVQALLTTIDAEKYSMQWNRNFFVNSAEPGGIITVPGNLEDDEFDQFTSRWRSQHRGVSQAHRVAILENGMTWQNNSFSQRDMQFAELRTVSRDTILEAYGMPGSMIGISEHVNKANAQTGEITFARWITAPRLERWKQFLNNDFLPLFGASTDNLMFDFESPIPNDSDQENAALTARSAAAALLVAAGYNDEDVLSTCELPPMRWAAPVTAPDATRAILPADQA